MAPPANGQPGAGAGGYAVGRPPLDGGRERLGRRLLGDVEVTETPGQGGDPRKDLRKWADFRSVYGYFFSVLFQPVTNLADPRFGGLDAALVRAVAAAFADGYQPDADDWVGQIRRLAADLGFAPSQKVYKQNPAAYPGSIVAVFQVIRVLLTGTAQSPGLASVATALGPAQVLRRVRALSGQREVPPRV